MLELKIVINTVLLIHWHLHSSSLWFSSPGQHQSRMNISKYPPSFISVWNTHILNQMGTFSINAMVVLWALVLSWFKAVLLDVKLHFFILWSVAQTELTCSWDYVTGHLHLILAWYLKCACTERACPFKQYICHKLPVAVNMEMLSKCT